MLFCLQVLAWGAVLLLALTVLLLHTEIPQASKGIGARYDFGAGVVLWGLQVKYTELFAFAVTILAAFLTYLRAVADNERRRMLEDGMLSIHACAIVWQAVIVAHFSAIENARRFRLSTRQLIEIVQGLRGAEKRDALAGNAEKYVSKEQQRHAFKFHPDGVGLTGYGFWLGQEAASLASCARDIHSWIAIRQCEGK